MTSEHCCCSSKVIQSYTPIDGTQSRPITAQLRHWCWPTSPPYTLFMAYGMCIKVYKCCMARSTNGTFEIYPNNPKSTNRILRCIVPDPCAFRMLDFICRSLFTSTIHSRGLEHYITNKSVENQQFWIFNFNLIFIRVPTFPHLSHYSQIKVHSLPILSYWSSKSVNAFQSYGRLNVPTETSEWSIPTHFVLSLQITEISTFELFGFHRPQW